MFDPIDPKQSFPALEEGILQYWKEEDVFHRSIEQRKDSEIFGFYDGPPFATGLPHYGHLLAGTIKDVIPRYQTMRGKKVQRRFGWDCHGLPIENLIEKENGIASRKEIEEMGIKAFNDLCRASVQRYAQEWRTTVERMGRWVDMDWDYKTMDPEYMESIWWVFSQLYVKGLIYEGHKPMHVCPRCVTALSNFEVTQGYKNIQDYAVTAMFEMDDGAFALVWTTTPWTLPGNLFLAVHPNAEYIKFSYKGNIFIIAKEIWDLRSTPKTFLAPMMMAPAPAFDHQPPTRVGNPINGHDLIGKKYKPLFPYYADLYAKNAFRVVAGDFVTMTDGTGIVHIAPGYGEDDFGVGRREKVSLLQHVDMDGLFKPEVIDFAGKHAKPKDDHQSGDKLIAQWLKDHGKLFDATSYQHSYPHCWRCDSPLLNYATGSWFVAVEKIKEDMLRSNAQTHWVPDHLRDGRFGKWLEGARDWAISRSRYWGTPLPIWRCDATKEIVVIGSRDALMNRCPERMTKITVLRHGESAGNLIPIYQGKAPGTDLTDEGRGQAAAAGAFLRQAHRPLAAIYASPIARTQQTAVRVAEATGATVITDDRLRELDMGAYEGEHIPFADLERSRDLRREKLATNSPQSIYHFEGMETFSQVQTRIESFFAEILTKHRGEHIAVVTHGDPILSIRHFFTKADPRKIAHGQYPRYATPESYFFDHETGAALDLHKETVDGLTWTDADGNTFKRIPEVLDCWFESGSMPSAQENFPFAFAHRAAGAKPPGFPADFIAEGVDQTRGWFYTLTVLAAALYGQSAFRHCIVNGTVLAEDGRKMSKRLKNYPDPTDLINRFGADAVRFALMQSPAVRSEDLRFSAKLVEEAVRSVLLPLWNSVSFFVTYANAEQWTPSPQATGSTHPLDQWIRAEVQDLVNRMTQQLDAYDLSATCAELHSTIDALTNWYIRLSRRRFAGKEPGKAGDAQHALQALYDVLLTIAQLLAPFCPFLTDAIYQNLVGEPHGSIHLTAWPAVRPLTAQEQVLIAKNAVLRSVVSLGNKIRSDAKIKMRQPLQSATVGLPASTYDHHSLVPADRQFLAQELNVKELHFTDDPGILGTTIVMVDARKAGPRLGKKVQDVIAAGKAGQFTVRDDGSIGILDEILSRDEAAIIFRGGEGSTVASDGGIIVSMDSRLNDALIEEGLRRDLIRQIQKLRKDEGYALGETVEIGIEGADALLEAHRTTIERETLVHCGKKDGTKHEVEIGDGEKVIIVMDSAGSP